jgi:8-amino-7-oxononanoate synthase
MSGKHSRKSFDFASLPEHEVLQLQLTAAEMAGIDNPFFRVHDRRTEDTTEVAGQRLINFASYDYLGLNGSQEVSDAAKSAIDLFGTSVGASRVVAGERQLHRDLEKALAALHGVEAALTFVSGHATNVTTIGLLLGSQDLIVADALAHNSILEGSRLSGAKKFLTPHGDYDAIERTLRVHRKRHRHALIAVEGLYSMEGDVPDLARLIEIKRRYDAWLFVDEAHSIGVLGATGRGIAEEQAIDPREVEIWMGTLSKAFAASGGYIAGDQALIDVLKTSAPGFVYSVGLSPPIAAAALAAVDKLTKEPERVQRLRANGRRFRDLASAAGLDVGPSIGAAVIPIIIGESPLAVMLSNRLFARGINVLPIIFPAVAERQARLRFFLTARHSEQQVDATVAAIVDELEILKAEPAFAERIAAVVAGSGAGSPPRP